MERPRDRRAWRHFFYLALAPFPASRAGSPFRHSCKAGATSADAALSSPSALPPLPFQSCFQLVPDLPDFDRIVVPFEFGAKLVGRHGVRPA